MRAGSCPFAHSKVHMPVANHVLDRWGPRSAICRVVQRKLKNSKSPGVKSIWQSQGARTYPKDFTTLQLLRILFVKEGWKNEQLPHPLFLPIQRCPTPVGELSISRGLLLFSAVIRSIWHGHYYLAQLWRTPEITRSDVAS